MTKSNLHVRSRHDPTHRAGWWIIGIAVAMVFCIAPADVVFTHFQLSILYAIPLTLLGCFGHLRALRWLALLVIGFTFLTYFPKYWLYPPLVGAQFINFRLVNRFLVISMLWLLARVLGLWLEAKDYRHDPLWSDELDRAHSRISAMLGMLIAMPTVVVIALVDGLTPGNFNLAVLYTVPLVACAWVRSKRLLWTLFVLLQVLAFGGLLWGPPHPDAAMTPFVWFNRIMNAVMMLIVTGLLHYSMRAPQQADQIPPLEDPAAVGPPSSGDEQVVAM
jgi:hypothetical protein